MKRFVGTIIATTPKTAIVEIVRRVPHKLYGKLLKRSTKLKVAVGDNPVVLGQTVTITETRKVSKGKYFMIESLKKENIT